MKSKLSSFFFLLVFVYSISSCSSDEVVSETVVNKSVVVVSDYDYSDIEIESMKIINDYRASKGLNRLEIVNHVSFKSEEHDQYMIDNNVVNHNDFDSRSENIIKALGASKVSENIAYNYNSPQEAFDAWLKSPGHRGNIEGEFTHFGISIRENPVNGRKYYTNIFVKI